MIRKLFLFFPPLVVLCACNSKSSDSPKEVTSQTVVVYTALDQIYSEPILKAFERKTGIRVLAVYDSEASKTTGLVNRLIAERYRPRCDVFWNNEILQTIRLKNAGLLDPYMSPQAQDIPPQFRDSDGCWTGFAARSRVLAFNTKLLKREDVPKDTTALADPHWRGKIGMAYPLFGTTATHAAFLFSAWGKEKAESLFQSLKDNDIRILDGNGMVCRAVADGELPLGLTDTDDAHQTRAEGKPIEWILLDHEGKGALLIPNTVALMRDAPRPDAGRRLIDYLLSPEVETALAESPSAQIPLRPGVSAPPDVAEMSRATFLQADFAPATAQIAPSADFLKGLFAKP